MKKTGNDEGMRIVSTDDVIRNVKEMCIEANVGLSDDVKNRLMEAVETETSEIGRKILGQLKENLHIAEEDNIPICQDTGMATVFVTMGQDVRIQGMSLNEAINEGIRQGYEEGFLRMSMVGDPLIRENTKDNAPGVIHYEIVLGGTFTITVAPKGFGSENMSRTYMLKPSDGVEGVKAAVLETVKLAGSNACPPMVIGVGIGGNFEKCTWLAKKALIRELDRPSPLAHIAALERELYQAVNALDIGPGGFGGTVTALGVNIETYPTHIAGLPVAINIGCHVNRHVTRNL